MDELPLFKWRPPATLAIFPSTRNLSKIQRIAFAAASSKNPENTIRATIDRARSSYVRKGLPPHLIDKDVADLEGALRTLVAFLQSRRGVAK